jgi:hypothetical protein
MIPPIQGWFAHFAQFGTKFSIYTRVKKFVFELRRLRSVAQKCRPTPSLSTWKERLLTRNVSNSLKLVAVKRGARFPRDLAESVKRRSNFERRDHRALELPIVYRLLARKRLISKGLEAALHSRCTQR